MLSLPNVTLICITSVDREGHQTALDESCREIEFGDVKLIWRPDIKNIEQWNKVIVYELGDYVETDYALLIHADGEIINPQSWRDEWLEYDYAGSPFPLPTDDYSYRDINGKIQRVGNSVGLRSKKLMDLPKKIGMEWKSFHGYFNEDGFISVNMRHVFEEHGCRFMPFREAVHFGIETPLPEHDGVEPFLMHKLG